MLFLALLLSAYALSWLVPRLRGDHRTQWRLALAAAMAVAGVAHLVGPTPFVQHLPDWVPARQPLVYATGVVEIALGGALLGPVRYRRLTGLALAAYLVAVFPANVYVAVAGVDVDGQPGGIYPWLRLPWQAAFVWLAWWTTRPAPVTRTMAAAATQEAQPVG